MIFLLIVNDIYCVADTVKRLSILLKGIEMKGNIFEGLNIRFKFRLYCFFSLNIAMWGIK